MLTPKQQCGAWSCSSSKNRRGASPFGAARRSQKGAIVEVIAAILAVVVIGGIIGDLLGDRL